MLALAWMGFHPSDLVCRHHLHHHPTKGCSRASVCCSATTTTTAASMQLECQCSPRLQPMKNPPSIHPHHPLLACLASLSVLAPFINPLLLTTKEGAPSRRVKQKHICSASSSLQASADASSSCKPALYALPLSLLVDLHTSSRGQPIRIALVRYSLLVHTVQRGT